MHFIAIIFLIAGTGSALLAFKKYKDAQNFLKKALTAKGKVVKIKERLEERTDSEGYTTTQKMYLPVIEFTTKDGQKITSMSQVSTANPNKWEIGQEIDILYDPENPNNAKINKKLNVYILPVIFIILAIIFLTIGLVLISVP